MGKVSDRIVAFVELFLESDREQLREAYLDNMEYTRIDRYLFNTGSYVGLTSSNDLSELESMEGSYEYIILETDVLYDVMLMLKK